MARAGAAIQCHSRRFAMSHPRTAMRGRDERIILKCSRVCEGCFRRADARVLSLSNIPVDSVARRRPSAVRVCATGFPMISFKVNGRPYQLDIEPETPLLWVIRDEIGLTGTKFGCGIAQCGACTVHVDGEAVRSCSMQVSDAAGKEVTTIEGLSPETKHPVQQAWLAEDVPQCGYCQSGQIMAAVAFLKDNPKPTDEDIDNNLTN